MGKGDADDVSDGLGLARARWAFYNETATASGFYDRSVLGAVGLLNELRDDYGAVLADHQRIVRDALTAHDGWEIDTQGDSYFAAFRRAKDAVAAAADAQRALAAYEWPDGTELRVRMGMHTGEPSVSEDGYLGLGVHRAARICSACALGMTSSSWCAIERA